MRAAPGRRPGDMGKRGLPSLPVRKPVSPRTCGMGKLADSLAHGTLLTLTFRYGFSHRSIRTLADDVLNSFVEMYSACMSKKFMPQLPSCRAVIMS